MSYKVELQREEHEELLGGVLTGWSRQEHDVHLVSQEGHKVFSHKVILSFYSSVLRKILSEPIHALTNHPVTIFLPASVSTISSLIQILVKGKLERNQTNEINVTEDIKVVAKAMGIDLNNCFLGRRQQSSLGSGRTVKKLPIKMSSQIAKDVPKPNKIVPKPSKITKKSKIKKELISEEISVSATKTLTIAKRGFKSKYLAESGKFACDVCSKEFAKLKVLYKHRRMVHKIKRQLTPKPPVEIIAKDEKYSNKSFNGTSFVEETENGLNDLDLCEIPTDEEIGYENTLDYPESYIQEE